MPYNFHAGAEGNGLQEFESSTGSPSVQGTYKNTGNYAIRFTASGSAVYVTHSVLTRAFTLYLYIISAPSSDVPIIGNKTNTLTVVLKSTRYLEFWDGVTYRSTGSTQLNAGQWYRISGSYTDKKVYLNGVEECSAATVGQSQWGYNIGVCNAVTADIVIDDFLSADSGSDPGDIRVLGARPVSNGTDADTATSKANGWADSTDADHASYDELDTDPPSEASFNCADNNLTCRFSVNLDDCGSGNLSDIGGSDTIEAVNFMWLYATEGGGTDDYGLRIRCSDGIYTNDNIADPKTATWISHYDVDTPQGGNPWTQAYVNSLEMGMASITSGSKGIWWYEAIANVAFRVAGVSAVSVNQYDTASVTDYALLLLNVFLAWVYDSLSVTDEVIVHITPYLLSAFDSISVSDEAAVQVTPYLIEASDAVTVTDEAAVLTSLSINVFDEVSVSDEAALELDKYLIDINDPVGVSDEAALALDKYLVEAFDSVAVADEAVVSAILPILSISVFDEVHVKDAFPQYITDIYELQDIENNLSGDFILANDIDCSAADPNSGSWDSGEWPGTTGFRPIGDDVVSFTGTFDGAGSKIFNLYINRPATWGVGLFGWAENASIINVAIEGADVTGDRYVGILCGDSYTSNDIRNCSSAGTVLGNDDYVGGLIGFCDSSTAADCFSSADVDGPGFVGGLIGEAVSGTVTRCRAIGAVTGTAGYIGGLIGEIGSQSLSLSCAKGDVSGDYDAGGLVGYVEPTANIENCFATGDVSASSYGAGGLIGEVTDSSAITVSKSYSVGSVSGTSSGGLIGIGGSNPVIADCFWDTQTSGQAASAGGTGKTTAEMKDDATYTDTDTVGLDNPWDFVGNPHDDTGTEDYWDIDGLNDGYPFLTSQPREIACFDAIAVSDESFVLLDLLLVSAFDAVGTTDEAEVSISGVGILEINVFDDVTVTDETLVSIPILLVSTFDSIAVQDEALLLLDKYLISADEPVSVSDEASVALDKYLVDVFDAVSTVDEGSAALDKYLIDVSDAVSAADEVSIQIPVLEISVFETVTVTDEAAAALNLYEIAVFDAVAAQDEAVTLLDKYLISADEAISVSDEASAVLDTYLIDVFDALSALDEISVQVPVLEISVSDAVTVTDEAAAALTLYEIAVFDPVAVTEYAETQIFGVGLLTINVYEDITVTDDATAQATTQKYSRGDSVSLPGDDADLATPFGAQDYDDVDSDDSLRVEQEASSGYAVFLFKDKHTQQDQIAVVWNGQTSRAPSTSPVYLQIYNRRTTTWETLDTEDLEDEDTDFDLSGSVLTDLDDYLDGDFWVACRVYQGVS